MGIIIVFLGTVGVGKSTIIKQVKSVYIKKGFKVHSTFIKSRHGLGYVLHLCLVKILGLHCKYAPWFELPYRGYIELTKILTLISALTDLAILMLKILLVKILKRLGYVILCEEYIHATILDYVYAANDLGLHAMLEPLIGIMNRLLKRYQPDFIIYLYADKNVLNLRWNARGYGDPNRTYVKLQREYLRKFIIASTDEKHSILALDTTNLGTKETVYHIFKYIKSR